LIRIKGVTPLESFRVRLLLTDGSVVERDLAPLLAGPIFEPLRSAPARFREVRVESGTLVWPNGADLCPDVVISGGPQAPQPSPVEPDHGIAHITRLPKPRV
jgi:hypothetical protein